MSALTGKLLARIEEIVIGTPVPATSLADQVCDRRVVRSLEGTVPIFAGSNTVAQGNGMVPVDAGPKQGDFKMGDILYSLQKSPFHAPLNRWKQADFDQYLDTVPTLMDIAKRRTYVDKDKQLEGELASTSKNIAVPAGNAWDSGSETINANIQDAVDAVQGADTIIIGMKTFRKLMSSDVAQAYASSGYSGDGVNPAGAVEAYLREVTGVSRIFVSRSTYNAALTGQALDLDHIMKDLFWIGSRRGLLLIDHADNPAVDVSEPDLNGNRHLTYAEVFQVLRAVDADGNGQEMGVVITGT